MLSDKKRLPKNALKCWYLRWLLAFILLLGFEIFTAIISSNLLYGLSLTLIKVWAFSFPVLYAIAMIFVPYLRYIGFSYSFEQKDKVYVYSGVVAKKRQIILVDNIQHVELKAYPFERLFKLATVKIFTAGSEHTLPSLSVEDALYAQSLAHKAKS
ncbi:MAG TPA: PH domain-containing protein [Clostridiales bacterium]|nr:PH domain-containing protein [Clostridiales bacterium]